ncbi:MAG: hypothetical protein OEV38_11950 [Nitrospira sp.]|nr:hypothetical protein [Nitrospira sp.]MDH5320488.1 hypothetical protein [Nitrospira sp.]
MTPRLYGTLVVLSGVPQVRLEGKKPFYRHNFATVNGSECVNLDPLKRQS